MLADLRHDGVQTLNLPLDGLDAARSTAAWSREGEAARSVVAAAGLLVEDIDIRFELDMHYLGQTHTVAVSLR